MGKKKKSSQKPKRKKTDKKMPDELYEEGKEIMKEDESRYWALIDLLLEKQVFTFEEYDRATIREMARQDQIWTEMEKKTNGG